jgi:2-C-methyl-D-erythritol 4-phosphate cytidylyltransferase
MVRGEKNRQPVSTDAESGAGSRVGAVIIAVPADEAERSDPAWYDLAGTPVVARSVRAFEQSDRMDQIVLVVAKTRQADASALRQAQGWRRTRVVVGGPLWHDALVAGLDALGSACQWVVIHEGNRPLVTSVLIEATIEGARTVGAASAGEPVKDTIKRVTGGFIVETPPRAHLAQLQTPQVFDRAWLASVCPSFPPERAPGREAALAGAAGFSVRVVAGSPDNLSVRTLDDLALARHIIQWHGGVATG